MTVYKAFSKFRDGARNMLDSESKSKSRISDKSVPVRTKHCLSVLELIDPNISITTINENVLNFSLKEDNVRLNF